MAGYYRWGSNARLGKVCDESVVEADESDGSLPKLKTVAVVTIDPEHLDHHGSFEALSTAFLNFVASITFTVLQLYVLVIRRCNDSCRDQGRRIITYGLSANADVRAINLR